MKIYTKTGDDGKTSLFDNSRVWKSNERIMSYGAVDELNSAIGVVISMDLDHQIKEILLRIQNDLFIVGSDLANPDMTDSKFRTTEKMVSLLENDIDLFEVNEAFSVVTEKFIRDLDVDREKINVNGGAMALGHPIGATGSILVNTIVDELERRDAQFGLVTMCAAGGMAPAIVIERM